MSFSQKKFRIQAELMPYISPAKSFISFTKKADDFEFFLKIWLVLNRTNAG